MLSPNNPEGVVDVIYSWEIGTQLSDTSWLTVIKKKKKKKGGGGGGGDHAVTHRVVFM